MFHDCRDQITTLEKESALCASLVNNREYSARPAQIQGGGEFEGASGFEAAVVIEMHPILLPLGDCRQPLGKGFGTEIVVEAVYCQPRPDAVLFDHIFFDLKPAGNQIGVRVSPPA